MKVLMGQDYWDLMKRTAAKVDTWPDWKKGNTGSTIEWYCDLFKPKVSLRNWWAAKLLEERGYKFPVDFVFDNAWDKLFDELVLDSPDIFTHF